MYESTFQIRVRYAETDRMGFVFHGHYVNFYEVGRTESIRQLGVTYHSLEEAGILMPVTDMSIKFLLPARYDDLLTVKTVIPRMPEIRMIVNAEISNEAGELINRSECRLTFLDATSKRILSSPAMLSDKLAPYF